MTTFPGIGHSAIADAPSCSGIAFRDPDRIALGSFPPRAVAS